MNTIGLVAAAATFFGVWYGHVAVRRIEFISKTLLPAALIFLAGGLVCEFFALFSPDRSISAGLGIFGVTILWDALELARQQERVKKGHAPANPQNPRHALILKTFPSATPLDLVKRGPLGRPADSDEAVQLLKSKY